MRPPRRLRGPLGGLKRTILNSVGRSAALVCTHTQVGMDALRHPNRVAEHDVTAEEIGRTVEANALYWSGKAKPLDSVTFIVPHLKNVLAGGITTVFRIADFLAKRNVAITIVVHNAPRIDTGMFKDAVVSLFPTLSRADFRALSRPGESLPPADVGVATFWPTAFEVVRQPGFSARAYLVQDFEPGFYPADEAFLLAEMSYRLGLKGLVNTPGLASFIKCGYGLEGMSFVPSVDTGIYHAKNRKPHGGAGSVKRVFFYGRPTQRRNAFGVGLRALELVKQRFADEVEILAAGEPWNPADFGVGGVIRNLGNVQSTQELGDLYRSCDVGLALMATRHPSYLPFELSACGCAVVANTNAANRWLLKDGETCRVAEPSGPCLAAAIIDLLENPEDRVRLAEGFRSLVVHEWSRELERIHRFLQGGQTGLEVSREQDGPG